MKRDRETWLIRVRDPAKMGRSSCSSCSTCSSSSTTSSSCVVGSSSSPPHEDSQQPQLQQKKKPAKRKRPTKPQNHSDESHNANSPTSAARRSSVYRGVTRHRWTGRFEAHLWDKSSWNNTQNKKGRQVYLGAYDSEEAAARTYDLAALKYWGPDTILNFPITAYGRELEQMQNVSKEEYLASLRRCSSGFSRGVSKYRGVARHHHNGRWEARIGRVLGNKYLYLGTYNTQEEAAAAYDMAAIQYRGPNAVTNFDISNYIERLQKNGVHIDLPHSLQQEDHKGTEVEQQSPQVQPKDEEDEEQQHLQEQLVAPDDPQQLLLGCTNDDGRVILSPPSMDSSCVMGPSSIDDHELTPWSFCMDDVVVGGGLDPLPVPDLLIDGRHGEGLPDLFDERGFEDNIDLIFESDDNAFGCGRGHADGDIMIRPEIVVSSEGSTSSPSSSTTSVSCNYTIN